MTTFTPRFDDDAKVFHQEQGEGRIVAGTYRWGFYRVQFGPDSCPIVAEGELEPADAVSRLGALA